MKNELIEEYLFPQDDKDRSARWWNSLADEKKIFLKDEFGSLTSVDYGLGLYAGGALKHESFNPPLNLIKRTNDEYSR